MTITILDLATGRRIYCGYFAELRDVWPVVAPVVAAWFEVPEHDVCCGESDDGDVIEINGKAVASITHEYRRAELQRPIYAEAAE